MPTDARVTNGRVFEDTAAQFLARLVNADGSYTQQADITSIAWGVYDTSDGSTVATGTLVVANTIYDALQTDTRWEKDDTGYNFIGELAGTSFPTAGTKYRVQFTFTPASGNAFVVCFDVTVTKIYS